MLGDFYLFSQVSLGFPCIVRTSMKPPVLAFSSAANFSLLDPVPFQNWVVCCAFCQNAPWEPVDKMKAASYWVNPFKDWKKTTTAASRPFCPPTPQAFVRMVLARCVLAICHLISSVGHWRRPRQVGFALYNKAGTCFQNYVCVDMCTLQSQSKIDQSTALILSRYNGLSCKQLERSHY